MYQRRIRKHLRKYRSGKVGVVKEHTANYKGSVLGIQLSSIIGHESKQDLRKRRLLCQWFGDEIGNECFDFAERYGDDRFVVAAIRGFSTDRGFNFLHKNRSRLVNTIHSIDKYIERNLNKTPREVFHGANLTDKQLRRALSGKPFSLTDGLFYASTSEKTSRDLFTKGNGYRCVFVISAYKGGYAHTERFSHHSTEAEVLFDSNTKVVSTGKPVRKDDIAGSYYEIPCKVIYKND